MARVCTTSGRSCIPYCNLPGKALAMDVRMHSGSTFSPSYRTHSRNVISHFSIPRTRRTDLCSCGSRSFEAASEECPWMDAPQWLPCTEPFWSPRSLHTMHHWYQEHIRDFHAFSVLEFCNRTVTIIEWKHNDTRSLKNSHFSGAHVILVIEKMNLWECGLKMIHLTSQVSLTSTYFSSSTSAQVINF